MTSRLLDISAIQTAVKSCIFGQNIVYRHSVSSTNTLAKELAIDGAELPLIVTAEEQTAGMGRLKRSWFSPFGKGIWLTIVFPPADEKTVAGHYNFLFSLAIAKAIIAVTAISPSFKWPNDIQLNERKICGILTESCIRGDDQRLFISGAGINVNIASSEFPEDIKRSAASLMAGTGKPVNRSELFIEIIKTVDSLYTVWKERGIEPIYNEWIHSCTTIGREVSVRTEQLSLTGTAERVQDDGSLIVRDSAGEMHRLYAGDVEYCVIRTGE
jgi:BirA family biotin operon repressor/biotin-[acetyl-CoA-carboxylase] ligase